MEIGAEAALFPEKEYIYDIFVAVRHLTTNNILLRIINKCTRQTNRYLTTEHPTSNSQLPTTDTRLPGTNNNHRQRHPITNSKHTRQPTLDNQQFITWLSPTDTPDKQNKHRQQTGVFTENCGNCPYISVFAKYFTPSSSCYAVKTK